MSFFNWCEEPPRPELPEQPEPKGLEIVTITPPEQIKVKVDGNTIGAIESVDGIYKFRMFATSIYSPPASYSVFNSESLKAIAAKLDELNGELKV